MMFKMVSKVLENQELILAISKQSNSNFAIKKLDTIAEYEDFIKSLEDDCVRLDLVNLYPYVKLYNPYKLKVKIVIFL